MRPNELFKRMREIQKTDIELSEKKNNDYAGEQDALANLGLFGVYGVCVRLSDKLMRLINFAKNKQLLVKDESIKDTLRDIRNYALLAEVMLDEEKNGKKTSNTDTSHFL